ncbi:MAG: prohibitin family protein [Leeuwenhoekiella sp.]
MKNQYLFLLLAIPFIFSSCAVVRPGEAGVKQNLGVMSSKVYGPGTVTFNPFTSKVIKTSVQTNNIRLDLTLPSKEGLSVESQISILYRLKPEMVPTILQNLGLNYESIVTSVFRSAASDVCAKFFAKDMHSGMRAVIEGQIQEKMETTLSPQGIVIEAVLMKSIQLPMGLARSIESKLQAEQDAMRMEFVLQQARLEADQKIINATGERDAQKILAEGLTDEIIKIRSIEAFNALSKSPNSKVIITDGKTPLLIDQN